MPKLSYIVGLASLALATFPVGIRAQEVATPGQTPTAQENTSDGSLSQFRQSTNYSAQPATVEVEAEADKSTETGVRDAVSSTDSNGRSFVLPSINLATQFRSAPSSFGYDPLRVQTYALGRLALGHVSGRSEFLLDYVGGGQISTGRDGTSSPIHALVLSRTISGRRSSLWFAGAVSYLSESPFGFNGFGVLDNSYHSGALSRVLGGSSAYLTTVTPNQTILTPHVPRLSAALVTGVERKLSQRSSWTAAGSYGLLHFSSAAYVSGSNVQFQTSYDYQVTRQNTVAVIYRFDAFRFQDLAQDIDEHTVSLSIARRMSNQWSVRIGAGPNVELFRAPLSGPASQFGWSVHGSLTYQLQRTALRFSYNGGLTGGSGVLVGAQTNLFQARVEGTLTRSWKGFVAAEYARNEGLTQTVPGVDHAPFQAWYGTVGLSRRLSRGSNLFVAYSTRSQQGYGALFTTHEISLGFSWGLRPIALE